MEANANEGDIFLVINWILVINSVRTRTLRHRGLKS